MQKDDVLILTSDGVTDAMDPQGQMYDEQRLIESIRRHAGEPISECVKSLYRDISEFAGNAEVNDDITMLALRRRQ